MTGQVQQQYHVARFRTWAPLFPVLDFAGVSSPLSSAPIDFCAQMFIQSLYSAKLVITRPNALLAGLYAINRIWPTRLPIRLKGIDYTISACNGDGATIATQDFTHPFHGVVMLHLTGEIRSSDGVLFKPFALTTLLDDPRFKGLKGIQFVA